MLVAGWPVEHIVLPGYVFNGNRTIPWHCKSVSYSGKELFIATE